MTTIEITTRVMKKVTALEKHRIRLWLSLFILTVTFFLLLATVFFLLTIQDFQDQDLVSLGQLLFSDPVGFWEDATALLLLEIPWDFILLGVSFLFALGLTVLMSQRKRRIVHTKQIELQKYK